MCFSAGWGHWRLHGLHAGAGPWYDYTSVCAIIEYVTNASFVKKNTGQKETKLRGISVEFSEKIPLTKLVTTHATIHHAVAISI